MSTELCASNHHKLSWWRGREKDPTLNIQKTCPKNNPGGLKVRKKKPKVVIHHESSHPSRCFVMLFKLYHRKCRLDDAFYLKPLSNPTEQCWFSACPIGHYTLSQTVAKVCWLQNQPFSQSYNSYSFVPSRSR